MAFRFGCYPSIAAGAGDTVLGGIGTGTPFLIATSDTTPTPHTIDWIYIDPVYFIGVIGGFAGGLPGDIIDYMILAPATVTGGGTQSVNLQPVTGGNLLVPVVNGGSTTVDGAVAVPVPNGTGTGWWDITLPEIGWGVVTPNYTQGGAYDLYDFQQKIARPLQSLPLLGSAAIGPIDLNTDAPLLILPQWTNHLTLFNTGHADLVVVGSMINQRARSI